LEVGTARERCRDCLSNTRTFVPHDRLQCLHCVLPIMRCAFSAHLDVGLAERQTPCRFIETVRRFQGNDPKAEAWVQGNAPEFDVKYRKVRQGAFFIIGGKPDAITRFLNASKQVGIVTTRLPGMPEGTQNEKGHSPASGSHANVATQDVSHILAMQQNAPLPLADSSVFAALSQPDVGVTNVANLIDIPGAASNAPRSASFSYFANRGPANQVGGQVRLQPTGLVAIMHTTSHTSHDEIKKETESKDLCCAYDVDVRASHDEIEEEEVQSLWTKSQVTPPLSETTTLLDTQPSTPVCVGSNLDAVVEDDEEDDMCDFNARLACLRDASCSGCKFCQRPEEQHPCNAYDVNVCSSDVLAVFALRRRIRDRCAANMIRLANDDDFMAALNIQISELEFNLYESQKQVNGIVYATYDQIWEMNETHEIDEIDLQNDEMKIDRIILDGDCNTPDCFNLPQRQYHTHIQHMPPIKRF